MNQNILTTFLDLGDATSRNLGFSHLKSVLISYGEETITESNLLEIRRRHPQQVTLKTFPRRIEAKIGADWEWHIIGRRHTLKMRVQAKRVQTDDKLKIKHKIRSTGKLQRDQLLQAANASKMKPIYCIYSTERQKSIWRQSRSKGNCRGYQMGCLLADANSVCDTTTRLSDVESIMIPWHFLFFPAFFLDCSRTTIHSDERSLLEIHFHTISPNRSVSDDPDTRTEGAWNHPTIDDLNGIRDRDYDREGIHETDEVSQSEESYRQLSEREVRGTLVIDVRDLMIPNKEIDEAQNR